MNVARTIPLALTGLFLILLPLQFLFAGFGIFDNNFDLHEVFGGLVLHAITLLMAIGFAAVRQWRFAALSLAMVIVIFLQIALVSIGQDNGQPWVSALHPFLAFCYWPYAFFMIWEPARAVDTALLTEQATSRSAEAVVVEPRRGDVAR